MLMSVLQLTHAQSKRTVTSDQGKGQLFCEAHHWPSQSLVLNAFAPPHLDSDSRLKIESLLAQATLFLQ